MCRPLLPFRSIYKAKFHCIYDFVVHIQCAFNQQLNISMVLYNVLHIQEAKKGQEKCLTDNTNKGSNMDANFKELGKEFYKTMYKEVFNNGIE